MQAGERGRAGDVAGGWGYSTETSRLAIQGKEGDGVRPSLPTDAQPRGCPAGGQRGPCRQLGLDWNLHLLELCA